MIDRISADGRAFLIYRIEQLPIGVGEFLDTLVLENLHNVVVVDSYRSQICQRGTGCDDLGFAEYGGIGIAVILVSLDGLDRDRVDGVGHD